MPRGFTRERPQNSHALGFLNGSTTNPDLPPLKRHHFQSDNLVVSQPKEGIPCHAERKN